MINTIEDINTVIQKFFNCNLISIVIFGSSVRREKFKVQSDVDYIIILDNLSEPQDAISRKLKNKLKNIFPLVAFNIYGKDDFPIILKHNVWLVLTVKLGYEIYFDKDNFFKLSVEQRFRKLKQKRVGRLAWYIENQKLNKSFLDHYIRLSGEYLKAARLLYDEKFFSFANELLLQSIHCFMINKLLKKSFFITSGEITQMFFNIYAPNEIFYFRASFLTLEQKVGQKHSFDFEQNGGMKFHGNQSTENDIIFKKGLANFEKLQIFFNDNDYNFTNSIKRGLKYK